MTDLLLILSEEEARATLKMLRGILPTNEPVLHVRHKLSEALERADGREDRYLGDCVEGCI